MRTFDRLAPVYDTLEAVLAGRKLSRCRNALWDRIPEPKDILLAGEGHGKSLAEAVRRYPDAQVTYLDASGKMHDAARRRLRKLSLTEDNVTFVDADILHWKSGAQYDLIVTQFFLDCFTHQQLVRMVPSLAQALIPGGHWMLADFQIPACGSARVRAQLIHWAMYRFFRTLVNLPASALVPPHPMLADCGLVRREHQEFDWGLLYADLWQRET